MLKDMAESLRALGHEVQLVDEPKEELGSLGTPKNGGRRARANGAHCDANATSDAAIETLFTGSVFYPPRGFTHIKEMTMTDANRTERASHFERPEVNYAETPHTGEMPVNQQESGAENELGARAMEAADKGREKAAEGVDTAASRLREQVEGEGGVKETVGVKVADGLERTAGYLREHETEELLNDLERFAREHPMQALGGAVVAGFLLGRVLR